MDQPQPPQPASSPVPTPTFTPSEQNPIVIDHKHRPIVGGAFIIIVLTLSIFMGGLLFANYWPNTDEPVVMTTPTPSASAAGVPADWKTYTNTEYGFEVKYPVNLELYEKKQSTFVSLIIDTPELIDQIKRIEEGPGGGAPLPTFLLTVSYDPDGKLRVESRCPTLEDGKSSTATQVTIGGVQALQCVDLARVAHNSERGPWLTTTFRNGSYHLWFSSGNYSGNEKQDYDQILSTFKFTAPASSVPADWKTYTNTQHGFEFKHPSTLTIGTYSSPRTSAQFSDIAYFGFSGRLGSSGSLSAAASIELAKQTLYSGDYKTTSAVLTKIAGYDAIIEDIQSIVPGNENDIKKVAFIKYGKTVFILSMFSNYWDEFNQILSTFKFTE